VDAAITIYYIFGQGIASTPQIVPKFQVAYENKDTKILCNSERKVKFYKEGRRVKNSLVKQNVLRLKKLERSDQGVYYCLGKNGKHSFNVSSKLLVGGKATLRQTLAY